MTKSAQKAQHTAGEWVLKDGFLVIRRDNHDQIANVRGAGRLGNAEADANARLISAAPDLLAAIERIQSMFGYGHIENSDDQTLIDAFKAENDDSKLRNLILEITGKAINKATAKGE